MMSLRRVRNMRTLVGQDSPECSPAAHVQILSSCDGRGANPSGRNLCAGKSLRKMPAAQRYVALVAADFYLRTFAFGGAIGLDTHHHDCLATAMADGLDLDDIVGPRQQLCAAREQFAAKVGPQSVTQHGNVEFVDHGAELLHLR